MLCKFCRRVDFPGDVWSLGNELTHPGAALDGGGQSLISTIALLYWQILTYGWSLPMLRKFYRRVDFPGDVWSLGNEMLSDGRRTFNFRAFLDANYQRSVD